MKLGSGMLGKSLDAALIRGVAWTGAATWLAQGLSWGSTLVVVHILTPDDYGLVALASVYLGLITLLSEFGVGTAIVTLRDLSTPQIKGLNSVAMLFAVVAVLISVLLSGLVAVFFSSPRLEQVIWVMSIVLVIGAFSCISMGLLQKELEFRFLAGAQVLQTIAASVTTLCLALTGAGYWSLAIGPVVGQAVLAILVMRRRPVGYSWPHWSSLKPALHFSGQVIAERAAWYGYTSADRFVIGRWLGEISVGLYSLASTFGLIAVEKITVMMLRVVPAVFSAVQNDPAALRRYLLSMTEAIAIVTFPVSIGLALVAPEFVELMLGDQWVGAVIPLQLLSVYGAFQSVSPLLNRVLAVIGETRFNMQIALITLAVLPLAFLVSTRWGLTGVAAAWLLVPVIQFQVYVRLRQRIGLRFSMYLKSLWPAFSSVVVMAGGILLLRQWAPFNTLEVVPRLVLLVFAGGLFYTSAMAAMHLDRVRLFRQVLAEMRVRREPGPVAA